MTKWLLPICSSECQVAFPNSGQFSVISNRLNRPLRAIRPRELSAAEAVGGGVRRDDFTNQKTRLGDAPYFWNSAVRDDIS